MRTTLIFAFATLLAASLSAAPLRVGYQTTALPAGSNTAFSVPFNRNQEALGALAGAPVLQNDLALVTAAGKSPQWQKDRFADLHYLRFIDGALAGQYFTILGNDADFVALDPQGRDLSAAQAGDRFEIAAYWTLQTLFPAQAQNGLLPWKFGPGIQGGTLLSYPDPEDRSMGGSPTAYFYFTIEGGWRQLASGSPDASNVIIRPDTFVYLSQPFHQGTRTVATSGLVDEYPLATLLYTQTNRSRDNPLSLNRPVPITLADSGLASGFEESPKSLLRPGDMLIVIGRNPSISFLPHYDFYIRNGGHWVGLRWGFPNADNVQIQPGSGLIARKAKSDGKTDIALTQPNH